MTWLWLCIKSLMLLFFDSWMLLVLINWLWLFLLIAVTMLLFIIIICITDIIIIVISYMPEFFIFNIIINIITTILVNAINTIVWLRLRVLNFSDSCSWSILLSSVILTKVGITEGKRRPHSKGPFCWVKQLIEVVIYTVWIFTICDENIRGVQVTSERV